MITPGGGHVEELHLKNLLEDPHLEFLMLGSRMILLAQLKDVASNSIIFLYTRGAYYTYMTTLWVIRRIWKGILWLLRSSLPTTFLELLLSFERPFSLC